MDNVFEIQKADDTWTEIPIKGVNMGIAKPGHFPGESAITKEEYLRWFKLIAEMNANTIRVYTLHPPAFYEALAEYNKKHADKLYVFHGVWLLLEGIVRKKMSGVRLSGLLRKTLTPQTQNNIDNIIILR